PSGGAALGTTSTIAVTIADNDVAVPVPGSFEFAVSSASVGESEGQVDITIKRVGGSDGAVAVDWRTSGVTATFAEDYGNFSWTPVTFADGETSKTQSITIVDDSLAEDNEIFNVILGNQAGGTALGTTSTVAVTIIDNDEAPTETTPPPTTPPASGDLRVFPGAEGFGTDTPAGRGGTIYKVTNLNDSGPGSLRAACEASGPRTVVFEISGTITLNSDIRISNPYLTVAGQTAPSPGITLRRAGLFITGHDVLVQHLRIRVGDESGGPAPSNRDGLQILWDNAYNVVVDHLSVSWAIDENGSTWLSHDVTISNTIFSEALSNSSHTKGEHSKGFLIGDGSERIALIGNLLAHNNDRQPLIKAGSSVLQLNNLGYDGGGGDWVGVGVDGENTGKPAFLSAVGNVFLIGPDSRAYPGGYRYAYSSATSTPAGTEVCLEDNSFPGGTLWKGDASLRVATRPADTWTSPLTVRPSSQVEAYVTQNAGARPADLDAVDERIMHEVLTRTGNIIDTPGQVGGWPNLAVVTRTFPTPANPNGDDDGDGYTNLEEVLHQMAAEVEGRL
ncbi:MAG: hypothetical protein C0617_15145, partial [Desulfuromonas sp.]|uniref:Calx-beta domain-containing protein n=1 Tax=Desulfuromonas sp. TaxID=892 RepID=UPI000CCA2C02